MFQRLHQLLQILFKDFFIIEFYLCNNGGECLNDYNGVCAYTVLTVSTTANNYCRYFFKNFLCIEVYAVQQRCECFNDYNGIVFFTACVQLRFAPCLNRNSPLVFSAFFHDKHHKCKLCTSVVLCRVLALVIFEVKSNIVVIRRN